MSETIPGRIPHTCRHGGTGWALSELGEHALSRCPDCGRWSFLSTWVNGNEVARWVLVRWYHWRLRRRIRMTPETTPPHAEAVGTSKEARAHE